MFIHIIIYTTILVGEFFLFSVPGAAPGPRCLEDRVFVPKNWGCGIPSSKYPRLEGTRFACLGDMLGYENPTQVMWGLFFDKPII